MAHSADVKCKDKQGYTPLHAAAVSGQLDVIKYLLKEVLEVKYIKDGIVDNTCSISCLLVNADESCLRIVANNMFLSAYTLVWSYWVKPKLRSTVDLCVNLIDIYIRL